MWSAIKLGSMIWEDASLLFVFGQDHWITVQFSYCCFFFFLVIICLKSIKSFCCKSTENGCMLFWSAFCRCESVWICVPPHGLLMNGVYPQSIWIYNKISLTARTWTGFYGTVLAWIHLSGSFQSGVRQLVRRRSFLKIFTQEVVFHKLLFEWP